MKKTTRLEMHEADMRARNKAAMRRRPRSNPKGTQPEQLKCRIYAMVVAHDFGWSAAHIAHHWGWERKDVERWFASGFFLGDAVTVSTSSKETSTNH
jgi:hypothetical protein